VAPGKGVVAGEAGIGDFVHVLILLLPEAAVSPGPGAELA